jgi:type IV pilus biogenesis protein PilP
MRIGNKDALSKNIAASMRTAFLVTVSVLALTPTVTFAADPAMMTPPPAPMVAPAAVVPPPAATAMNASPTLVTPDPADLSMAGAPKGDMGKNVSALEDKATDNARSIVKSLDGTDTLTLEDLNRARQTIARIDALIDVEKRLTELEKLRNERTGGSMAGAIPASALNPGGRFMNAGMGMGAPQPMAAPAPVMPMAMPVMAQSMSGTEVTRIMGTDGKYSAVLKTSDGDMHTVRPGDQINGKTVRSISSSSVTLEEKGGESKVLHVKNVDMVFSETR